MAYEKRYNLETTEGRDEALVDFVEWVGEEKADVLAAQIATGAIQNLAMLRMICDMFLGISGAPVTAFGRAHGLEE